jgi:hypothetical protein
MESDNTTRCNLSTAVLELLALGISDILDFDFMDKPSRTVGNSAIITLIARQCMCHYKSNTWLSVDCQSLDWFVLIQALQSALELLCLLGAVEKDEKLQAGCDLNHGLL